MTARSPARLSTVGRRPSTRVDDLVWAGVARLGRLLREREISPVELTRLFLERLGRLGPKLNALAALMPDRALDEARAAEAAIGRGEWRGPLHGVPYGAKDLLAARGAPTTWGAPPYRDQVIEGDATVVARLGAAGAPLAAKLAMVELAGGGVYRYAAASLHGPGLTPWNTDHWSGGSSSGSGSAVAAGLVPFALGSETSGSIVTPASYCGVTGLRPTYGLVSRHGAMPLSWTLDKIGPIARSAEDCWLVLPAIAGPDPADPTTGGPSGRRPGARRRRRLRVAFAPADFDRLAARDARASFAEALGVFQGLDVAMVETSLPTDLPYDHVVRTIFNGEAASIFGDLIESPRLEELADARQKAGLRAALRVTAREYLDAQRARVRVQRAFAELFERADVLLSVGRPRGAPRIDEPIQAPARGALKPDRLPPDTPHNAGLIPAGNLAGLPALTFPCGFDADDLPLALQVVGPPFSEATLVGLGRRFQQATDWHTRRPPDSD
ncbi:MAG TPA: amidase [Chloroflexota bacterium]|jgi:aspartyl-tRNA(Asn)/glutamyl-tRNA(Gln) amidotransferase subunit A